MLFRMGFGWGRGGGKDLLPQRIDSENNSQSIPF